jgi:anti-sigma regulatory factor (Ser/Thr protein kinase)
MCKLGHRTYYCDWATPAPARSFCTDEVTSVLGYGTTAQSVIDDLNLVVSELVTNAVQAGCSELDLDLQVHRNRIRVTISDQAPGRPEVQHPASSEERGRGLQLVAQLSSHWGISYADRPAGKQVWADLAVQVELTEDLICSG